MVTKRPELVCGIHFFNPAPAMKLVEVVRPLTASDETIAAAMAFATACGKDAVEVKDRAGFIVNALLFPYLNNAMRMAESGTASMESIDTAMKGGCNFPMGPFALLDLVGLDTSLAILDALYEEFRDPNYAAAADAAPPGRRRASSDGRRRRASTSTERRATSRPDRPATQLAWPYDAVVPIEPPPCRWRLPDPARGGRARPVRGRCRPRAGDGARRVPQRAVPDAGPQAGRRVVVARPAGRAPARRTAREPVAAPELPPVRGPRRHVLPRGDDPLRRSRPAARLDHAGVRRRVRAAAPSSAGCTASRRSRTASSSVGSTACTSAGCSPASRCSRRATDASKVALVALVELAAGGRRDVARRAVGDDAPRVAGCGRDPARGVPRVAGERRPLTRSVENSSSRSPVRPMSSPQRCGDPRTGELGGSRPCGAVPVVRRTTGTHRCPRSCADTGAVPARVAVIRYGG